MMPPDGQNIDRGQTAGPPRESDARVGRGWNCSAHGSAAPGPMAHGPVSLRKGPAGRAGGAASRVGQLHAPANWAAADGQPRHAGHRLRSGDYAVPLAEPRQGLVEDVLVRGDVMDLRD